MRVEELTLAALLRVVSVLGLFEVASESGEGGRALLLLKGIERAYLSFKAANFSGERCSSASDSEMSWSSKEEELGIEKKHVRAARRPRADPPETHVFILLLSLIC